MMSKGGRGSVTRLPTKRKRGQTQPPFGTPLLISVTPAEIAAAVGGSSTMTTAERSLEADGTIAEPVERLEAVNARSGNACRWYHEEWIGSEEAEDAPVPHARFLVELQVGGSYVQFFWEFEPNHGDAEYAYQRRASERCFMRLARMIGVPAGRVLFVAEPGATLPA
jgi:hypothetical protein